MMKIARFFAALLFLLVAGALRAQTYTVIADDGAEDAVAGLQQEMELRFEVYNRLFRFDPSLLSAPLAVRVFSDEQDYSQYIAGHLGDSLGDDYPKALYLHYNQIDRRELVLCLGSSELDTILAHQAFIQFLRAFVANPPSWMREGFSIYFSTLRIVLAAPEYEENLAWLESAKDLGANLPSPNDLFLADISPVSSGNFEDFQISSWALVSFLLNGSRDYFRTLTDSFMLLSPIATVAENSQVVAERFALWHDNDALERDFRSYLDSRKTFKELMDDGHDAYSRGEFMNAELSFMAALSQKPADFAPYYYLGLLYYEAKEYDAAEYFYQESLDKGGDAALINYALGLNAVSDGRNSDAAGFLRKAAEIDPARYRTRADDIIRRIGQ